MKYLLTWTYKYPRLIGFFLLFVTVLAGIQIPKLEIDSTLDKLMIKGDPALIDYDRAVSVFGSDVMTAIYLKGDDLFTHDNLEIIRDIIYELEKIPIVKKIESLFNSPHFRNENDYLKTSPLFDDIPESPEEINKLLESGLKNPLIKGILLESNKKAMSIFVYAENTTHDSHFNDVFSMHIEKAMEPIVTSSKLEVAFQLGPPYIHHVIGKSIIEDQFVLMPLSILVIVLFMYLGMGSFNAAIIPIATASISLIWTLGFMGFFGFTGDMINSTIPLLIFILGCTEDTHIISEYLEGLHVGHKKLDAIDYVSRKIGLALFLTVSTTILSYGTLTVNEIIMLKEFGIVASVAMFLNFIVTFTFIPIYLKYFGENKIKKKEKKKYVEKVHLGLLWLAEWVYRISLTQKKYTLTGIAIFIGVCIYYGRNVRAENDPLYNFKESSFIRKNSTEFNKSFPGITNFYIHFIAPREREPFKRPENLKKIFEIYKMIENEDVFDSSRSFAELIALVNREMTTGDDENFIIPDDPALISQYMLFFARDDLEKYIGSDFNEANMVVNHHISRTTLQLKELDKLHEKIKEILKGTGIEFKFTGKNILMARASMTIVQAQINSLELLVLIIFLLMLMVFKSFKIALLSLIPNFFPVIGFFGILGIFDIPLNIGTSIIAVISLGIVIDDTIHFFVRFNENMKELQDQNEAIRQTIKDEIKPITITSLALAIGLSITIFSGFVPVIFLGTLTGVVIVLALIADLVLTPKLLMLANIESTTSIFEYFSTMIKDEFVEKNLIFMGVAKKDIRELMLSALIFDEERGDSLFIHMKEEMVYIVLDGAVKLWGSDRRHDDSLKKTVILEYKIGEQFGTKIRGPFFENTEEQLPDIEILPHSKIALISKKYINRMDIRYPEIMKIVKNNLKILNYT